MLANRYLRLGGHLSLAIALLFFVGCARKAVKKEEPQITKPEVKVVQPPKRVVPPKPEVSPEERERMAREKEERLAAEFRMSAQDFESELVHFDFDKSEIKPEYKAILDRKAEFLLKYKSVVAEIEGHCDERGTIQYNIALGERRSVSAKRYLVALGVEEGRLKTISYGEEKPLDPGHSEEAWSKNRRAKFRILSGRPY